MSNSRSPSPSSRRRPSSQTNIRSRSPSPRHRYTPSPPPRYARNFNSVPSPPSRKRYRSNSPRNSPRTSPPRKFSRPSSNRYLSPSRQPYQSRPAHHSYRSTSPYNRRSPDNRYTSRRDRYNRSISPLRYRSSTRNIPPSPPPRPSPNRHSPSRRRYYSPPQPPQSYRSRYPETPYPPSESRHPSLRPSNPSRSRSPRHRREKRRRDRRRRQREPLSPSQRIPDEQVHQLFLEALKLVLRYRRPPFNISVISDYMTSIDPNWAVRKTNYHTFSDLCRLQESRDHLRLARHGESVVMNSSKYEPDALELKPRDLGRRKTQRDRDRGNHRDTSDHIDPIRRRDWDLEERAAARKERFREDKHESLSNADAPGRSSRTSFDHFEEPINVTGTRDSPADKANDRDTSRGISRDGGSGTTTPNGVEAAETTAASHSMQCASPLPDSSRVLTETPVDTDSALKAELPLHCTSAPKSDPMPSTTEGDDMVK